MKYRIILINHQSIVILSII